jgi:hypothetical protein
MPSLSPPGTAAAGVCLRSSSGQDVQHSANHAERPDPNQSCYDVQPHPALSNFREGLTNFWVFEPINHALTSGSAVGERAHYIGVTTPR